MQTIDALTSHGFAEGDLFAERYPVERLLGRGGMGIVFAARHPILDQTVAIKLLLSDLSRDDDLRRRFMNEAKASALIENEHVVRVFDVATLPNGQPYIVMEHLDGRDLAKLAAQKDHRRLPYAEVVDYVLQALCGISAAHLQGIIHRDLKPSNIFRADRRDRSRIIKVLDFGISKLVRPEDEGSETTTEALLGSPAYMSPEQARSTKLVDGRTDIWSMGVVLHELITGSRPFSGGNVGQLIVSVLENEPESIDTLVPGVPAELAAVIRRCLEKAPEDRYPTVVALALALEPFAPASSRGTIERIVAMSRSTSSPPSARESATSSSPASPSETSSTTLTSLPLGGNAAPPATIAALSSRKGLLVGSIVGSIATAAVLVSVLVLASSRATTTTTTATATLASPAATPTISAEPPASSPSAFSTSSAMIPAESATAPMTSAIIPSRIKPTTTTKSSAAATSASATPSATPTPSSSSSSPITRKRTD